LTRGQWHAWIIENLTPLLILALSAIALAVTAGRACWRLLRAVTRAGLHSCRKTHRKAMSRR
jgi:hypothetical protein